MKLTVLGSSSRGNCYLLSSSAGSSLIIECGLHFADIKKALDFDIDGICAVLVSHEHDDHCKHVQEYINAGINVFSGPDVAKKFPGVIDASNFVEQIILDSDFSFATFRLHHDVHCMAFMIHHPEMGMLIFATDTHFMPARFNGFNHYLLECNYSNEIMEQKMIDHQIDMTLRERISMTHMSLEYVQDYLSRVDTSKAQTIMLMHLSDGNSDEQQFKSTIEKTTGVNVTIADAGVQLDLTLM